jgi:hypothetical protein
MSSRKRIAVPLTEKKRYAEMIIKGASRSTISDLYRKKYKSELPERTFFRWKKEAKSLVEVKSNHRCVQSWKKSTSMEKFEEKIKEEYGKRQIKLKKRGLTSFVRQVQTELFADDEIIKCLKLSTRFITRIIRDCGRKTSKRTDRKLTEEQKLFEFTRLRARRSAYPLRYFFYYYLAN